MKRFIKRYMPALVPLLFFLAWLVVPAGCAIRDVRDTPESPLVADGFAIQMANRIDNLETALVLIGEAALAARHRISDEDWDRFADRSNEATKAIAEAKGVLQEYRATPGTSAASRTEKAVILLESVANAALTYGRAVSGEPVPRSALEPPPPVIGRLEIVGGES